MQKTSTDWTIKEAELRKAGAPESYILEYKKTFQDGNTVCINCGDMFTGWEGKEDTCPNCLKNILLK